MGDGVIQPAVVGTDAAIDRGAASERAPTIPASVASVIGDDALLTPQQLAALTGRSPATLAWWRARGTGPAFVRVGRKMVAYRLGAYRAWLADCERQPKQSA